MSSLSGDDIEMAVTASATPLEKGETDSAGPPISDGGIESEENQGASCRPRLRPPHPSDLSPHAL